MILQERIKQKKLAYSTLKPVRLSTFLDFFWISFLARSVSKEVMIRRLRNDDPKSDEEHIKSVQIAHDEVKHELEFKTGRLVNTTEVVRREDTPKRIENQVEREAEDERPLPAYTGLRLQLEALQTGRNGN
jgi:hypothetical protein